MLNNFIEQAQQSWRQWCDINIASPNQNQQESVAPSQRVTAADLKNIAQLKELVRLLGEDPEKGREIFQQIFGAGCQIPRTWTHPDPTNLDPPRVWKIYLKRFERSFLQVTKFFTKKINPNNRCLAKRFCLANDNSFLGM